MLIDSWVQRESPVNMGIALIINNKLADKLAIMLSRISDR